MKQIRIGASDLYEVKIHFDPEIKDLTESQIRIIQGIFMGALNPALFESTYNLVRGVIEMEDWYTEAIK